MNKIKCDKCGSEVDSNAKFCPNCGAKIEPTEKAERVEVVEATVKDNSGNKVNNTEIDFVAENRNGIKYFQVALTVRDEEVLKRELRSLKNTEDHYPKYLITMDMDLIADYEGITKINIVDWLLQ